MNLEQEIEVVKEEVESAYNREEIVELASTDLDMLAGLALPNVLTLLFPPVFVAIWQLLTSSALKYKDFTKLAIGLPRGFGKTTMLKLFIFWAILFSDKQYILITASNQTKAENILSDVMRLFNSPNISALFGNVLSNMERDTTHFKQFYFNGRLITLQALGSGGDPRGSNVGFSRPDLIISDDIQSRDNAFSETQAKALRDWYYATLMPAKSEKGCLFIYIGNMFPTDGCLLKEFRDSEDWISFIAGAILVDGTSIWEELFPLETIIKDLNAAIRANNAPIFFSEILNDSTAVSATKFDPTKVVTITKEQVGDNQGAFVIIDPSGRKTNSDHTAIGSFILRDGIPYTVGIFRKVLTPLETIKEGLRAAMNIGASCILVENYSYQDSLLFWFDHVCKAEGIWGFDFLPISKGTTSKNSAILASLSQVNKGEIGFSKEVLAEYITDVVRFDPQSRKNYDDYLDVVAYSPLAVLKYRTEIGRVFNSGLSNQVEMIQEICPI